MLNAVPDRERERVDAALSACTVLSLTAGSTLGPNRVAPISLFLVEEGLAFVSAPGAGRRRMLVALAGPGYVLLAPSAGQRLEALTGLRMTVVTAAARRELLEIPAVAALILDGLAGGLRDCQESLSQFASLRHVDRVRHKLYQLARGYGKVGTTGISLHLPLTHELLADMVGSSRETVTRALSELAREGLVRHERGSLQLAAVPEVFLS